jgi:hypothetical protein
MRAPDNAAGRKTKCPKCGTGVVVPKSAEEVVNVADEEHLPKPVKRVEPPVMLPKALPVPAPLPEEDDFDFEPRSRRRPTATAAVSNTIIVQHPSRAAHSLGIAALVIGVLSFFVCWIPFLGIAVSGFGLLLGLGGVVLAIIRSGSGVGYAIAGSGLSALSLIVCLVWTFALSSAFKAVDDAVAKQGKTNQRAVQDANPNKAQPDNQGDAHASAPKNGEPEWADVRKGAVRQGDLQIRITEVKIEQVPLKTITGNTRSKENLLMIKLELLNTNPTKKVDYHSWSGKDISFDRDFATLKDNFDNSYKRIGFGLGSYPIGAVERSESIYPNKSVADVLVFEVPLDTVEYLRLELPAKNFEGTGMVRFQIPKSTVKR